MKIIRFPASLSLLFLLIGSMASAQGLNENEPARQQLGAPVYPGAVFIRTATGLDPYHATAEFVTRDKVETVLAFFERKLPDKRQILYEDKDIYLVAFLMKTWSKLPGSPKKEELALLENEPNLQLRTFDSTKYGALIDYFSSRPNGRVKADALGRGNTMIRYTYRMDEAETSAKNIIGTWRNVDRALNAYFGSVVEFRENGAYTLTLTAENLKEQKKDSGGNSETGTFVVMTNTITLQTQTPSLGKNIKSGIVNVGRASLSLEVVGLPRLTFIRVRK
ncbi:MAG: hypothetical protein ACYC9O_08145 [Candidatus Latescibacterota bacterium]